MKALRHRLAELDSGVRNAWLLIAILVVALICTMETMAGLAADNVSAADCLAEFIFVAIVGWMAFRPVTGCVAVAVAWIVLCMSPIWMPSGAMLAMLLAVGIAGYTDKRLALAVAGIAVVVWMLSRGGVAIPRLDGGSDTMSGSADGALDRTHQVIDVIEGRGEAAHSAVTPHDSTVDAASGIACDITDADCPLETQTYPPAPASTVTDNY